ncbi:MAG: TlyA family RNA methyltransferase [Clostridia bacterium]|nr:TlyA family RNA methyltransferase [Clostridia bacterium]
MNEGTVRLDARLVALGLATGREKAKELIAAGQVLVNGKPITKPSQSVSETDEIVSLQGTPRFVGRGGYKFEKAVEVFGLDLTDVVAADIGASTGGFTQCMLQNGASHVYAIDVGQGQLHESLRADPRVTCMEKTDIRDRDRVCAIIANGSLDFAATDVSFISLRLVVPAALPLLKTGASFVCLIKPQFEAGRKALDKHGIVKDPADHRRVLEELTLFFSSLHLSIERLDYSPICGGDGNIEYLALLRYRPEESPLPPSATDLNRLVTEAFTTL